MRCELRAWLAQAHGLHVDGVATPLDAVYARGIGAYYNHVIEPVERAALRAEAARGGAGAPAAEGGCLGTDAPLALGTGEAGVTYGEVLRREAALYDAHARRHQRAPDKELLARYCLQLLRQQPPYEQPLLFLDDRRAYLEQVQAACAAVGVACHAVLVDPARMAGVSAYEAALRRAGVELRDAPSSSSAAGSRRDRRGSSANGNAARCVVS